MPTQRKRIGFLPRMEVQTIIDQICKQNKLSQSKVTGILVEEALNYRGILNSSIDNESCNEKNNYNESLLIKNHDINNKKVKPYENINLANGYINEEIQMINDFIEFKFFKNIMNKNKKNEI